MPESFTPNGRTDNQLAERTIRVFISSTFRDMQIEHDLLVKNVFPELRSICAQRFVTFTEIDLRWGITKEQSDDRKTLSICLDEVRLSRPFFIGILGERYGSTAKISDELLEKEAWLTDHTSKLSSNTDLEILLGVLNVPRIAAHAYFYIRDHQYLSRFHGKKLREMIEHDYPEEIKKYGRTEAARRTEWRKERLEALKQQIRTEYKEKRLHLVDNYPAPEAFAEAIRRDFIELIDRLYPENEIPSAADREKQAHEVYARRKLLAYVPRPWYTSVLDDYVNQEPDGKGLVITGNSGSGKTTLLVDWALNRQKSHPGNLLFQHYFGATFQSTSIPNFLQRLLGDLKRFTGIADDIPATRDKMIETLPLWLAETAGKGKVILVLDALDQIQGAEPDKDLSWLPRHFPDNVRVIASALPSAAIDTLSERQWKEHSISSNGIEGDEGEAWRIRVIDKFFEHYRKSVSNEIKGMLARANGSKNLLFLRTVLEELRQFGHHTQLIDEVKRYLKSENPEQLFFLVVDRWQRDFDEGHDLVRRTLRSVWASKWGLSETEILALLGSNKQSLPRRKFSPLFLAMEPHLTLRQGLYSFGHEFLDSAVTTKFLNSKRSRLNAHSSIAQFFKSRPLSLRKTVELPYQLRKINKGRQLIKLLLDIPFFSSIFNYDKFELLEYWIWLRRERKMGTLYLNAFENWSHAHGSDELAIASAANELSVFLNESSLYNEAEVLIHLTLEITGRTYGPNHLKIAAHLNNLAVLYRNTNRLGQVEGLMNRALDIFLKEYGANSIKVAFQQSNLGMFLQEINNMADAERMIRGALTIFKSVYGDNHPETAIRLNYLATLLFATDRFDEAESCMLEALQIDELNYGKNHPKVANDLNNLAQLRLEAGNLPSAESLLNRASIINQNCYGKDHPYVATNLNNLAQLFKADFRFSEAQSMLIGALAINELNYGETHTRVAIILKNMANLFIETGAFDKAAPLIDRALLIEKDTYGNNHPQVATCLYILGSLQCATGRLTEAEANLRLALKIDKENHDRYQTHVARDNGKIGSLLVSVNRLSEAEPLLQEALEIDRKYYRGDHPNIATDLNNLAEFFRVAGRLNEAEAAIDKALDIDYLNHAKDHPNVARDLNTRAQILTDRNKYDDAEQCFNSSLKINEFYYGKEHVKISPVLGNMANLYMQMTKLTEAKSFIERALSIEKKHYGNNHPNIATCLYNLSTLYRVSDQLASAESFIRQALSIDEKSYAGYHPNITRDLMKLAGILIDTNRLSEAEQMMRRALQKDEEYYGKSHPKVAADLSHLAELFKDTNRMQLAERELLRALAIDKEWYGNEHPVVARDYNNLAILFRKMDKLRDAESFMRISIDIDRIKRGEAHPKIPHKMMSLSIILIMQNKLNDATSMLDEAWQLKREQHDLTSARILFLQIMIALLQNQNAGIYIGKLKTLWAVRHLPDYADTSRSWDIRYIFESLGAKLPAGSIGFLEALLKMLNDSATAVKPDKHPLWSNQPSLPLE